MANTKDYAMREMVLDRLFSTGGEYTREEGCRVTLDVMVNNELRQELAFYRDHLSVEEPESLK